MEFLRDTLNEETHSFKSFIKWLLVAVLIGVAAGLVGSTFSFSISYVTQLRAARPWIIWMLPLGGLAIAALYRAVETEGKGTDDIIGSIHLGNTVNMAILPSIFISTIITHLFGGSAGREGAALQIGGSLGSNIGRLVKLDEKEERIAVLAGMSAVFSALFGTPVAASVFALEVCSVGILHYSGLVPCLTAALVAYGITVFFGLPPTRLSAMVLPVNFGMLLKVALLSVVAAAVCVLFCELMHASCHLAAERLKSPFVRILFGSAVVIAMTLIVGNQDYNGGGMDIIVAAVERGQARPEAFILKMMFTIVSLSCGFKGGEIVPTFFIGATLGCTFGPLLGIPAGFAAAICMIAMFCGAVNCPVASTILAVEIFGAGNLIYFALACFISYMLSGYSGLYLEQKIVYSKLKAEYINKSTH